MSEVIKEAVLNILDKSEFIKSMELEFLELDEKSAVARIPFKSKFFNPYGSVHGGMLYAMGDTVAGSVACMSGNMCTTVDGNLSYLEPAINTQYVYCYAKAVRTGKHLINVNVEIKGDNGQIFDTGIYNYFKLDKVIG